MTTKLAISAAVLFILAGAMIPRYAQGQQHEQAKGQEHSTYTPLLLLWF